MSFIIDAIYVMRELLTLLFVIITSPFAFVGSGLLLLGLNFNLCFASL